MFGVRFGWIVAFCHSGSGDMVSDVLKICLKASLAAISSAISTVSPGDWPKGDNLDIFEGLKNIFCKF